MNSEELELSLRAEFESYLKGVVAGMQQDVSDFQKNFEAEFEKHKSQLDEAVRNLSTRFDSGPEFGKQFTQAITEHLRLARDEGATITAEAIGAAEKLKSETEPTVTYDQIRDAIKDITSQQSQSAILKSLVDNAGQFAPRGAFFIVKNDHFVGWRVFGKEGDADERTVQEIHFPTSVDTLLSSAANSLGLREATLGTHTEDGLFLEPLGFGRPDRMYAIPLVARGRGVAVMYADYGTTGVHLNADALETLVRVAGLTVELLAASNEAKSQQENAPVPAAAAAEIPAESLDSHYPDPAFEDRTIEAPAIAVVQPETLVEQPPPAYKVEEYTGEVSFDQPPVAESANEIPDFGLIEPAEFTADVQVQDEEVTYFEPVQESEAVFETADTAFETQETAFETATAAADDFAVQSSDSFAAAWDAPEAVAEPEPETAPVEEYVSNGNGNGNGNGHAAADTPEPVVEAASAQPAARTRYSERNVDLPIDVSDDERREHNNARRFARLLVSEIKLYNEQKVSEGREANDLYDRLRDAIDRSREMYQKRVQPEVAARFDYFHYELVNGLAEGRDERLGQSYPGSNS